MRRIALLLGALVIAVSATATAIAQDAPEEQITTLKSAPMPKLTGLTVDQARKAIDQAGIYADLELEDTATAPAGARIGQVTAQDPAPGDEVETGIGDLEPVLLTVYTPKTTGAKAPAACEKIAKGVKGFSYDIARQVAPTKMKFNINYFISKRPAPAVIRKVDPRGCNVAADVSMSSSPQSQDLLISLQPRKRRATLTPFRNAKTKLVDLSLVSGQPNFFTLSVVNKHTLKTVAGATLDVDASDVGGKDVRGRTSGSESKTSVKVTPKRGGGMDVVATVSAGNGRTLYGYARINVVDKSKIRKGFRTMRGDLFTKRGGTFKFNRKKMPKAKAAAATAAATEEESDNLDAVVSDEDVCKAFEATTAENCADGAAAAQEGTTSVDQARDQMAVVVTDTENPVSQDLAVGEVAEADGLVQVPGESGVEQVTIPALAGDVDLAGVTDAPPARAAFFSAAFRKNLLAFARKQKVYKSLLPIANTIRQVAARTGKAAGKEKMNRINMVLSRVRKAIAGGLVRKRGQSILRPRSVPTFRELARASQDGGDELMAVGSVADQDASSGIVVDYTEETAGCVDYGQWVTGASDGLPNIVGFSGQRGC